jgi:hypothetical protein
VNTQMNNYQVSGSHQKNMMGFSVQLLSAWVVCLAIIVAIGVGPAFGQSADTPIPGSSEAPASEITPPCDTSGGSLDIDPKKNDDRPKHIGWIYERIHAAKKRTWLTLAEGCADIYSQYIKAKDKFQKATNIQYSAELAVMYQWGTPHASAPASQMLFVPSVNWDIFKDSLLWLRVVPVSLSSAFVLDQKDRGEESGVDESDHAHQRLP